MGTKFLSTLSKDSDTEPPTTTKGDLSGFSSVQARVPVGTNNQVLTADSTTALGVAYKTPVTPPTTTKGDLSGYSTAQARIPIGSNNQVLTADSAQALGLKWATPAGGGWETLGSTVLDSSGDTITVSSFASKKYLHMEFLCLTTGGNTMPSIKFNSSGSDTDYAIRDSQDGGTDDTQTGQTEIRLSQSGHGGTVGKFYGTLDIMNVAAEEKMIIGSTMRVNADGSGTAPARYQLVAKYVDTNAITTAQLVNNGSGDFDVASSLIVFGRDD
jgi:hypothetical protein